MAAIDMLRTAVQDARSAGFWTLPASESFCFRTDGDATALDLTQFLILTILSLRDVYQQVQQNTADIAAIKTKLNMT